MRRSRFYGRLWTTGWPRVSISASKKDPDLQSLHGDPRFAALVAHAKERAVAAQKTR